MYITIPDMFFRYVLCISILLFSIISVFFVILYVVSTANARINIEKLKWSELGTNIVTALGAKMMDSITHSCQQPEINS